MFVHMLSDGEVDWTDDWERVHQSKTTYPSLKEMIIIIIIKGLRNPFAPCVLLCSRIGQFNKQNEDADTLNALHHTLQTPLFHILLYYIKDIELLFWIISVSYSYNTAGFWVVLWRATPLLLFQCNHESLKLTNCFHPTLMTEDTDKKTNSTGGRCTFVSHNEVNEPHQMDSWFIIFRHRWVKRMSNAAPFHRNYCQIALD